MPDVSIIIPIAPYHSDLAQRAIDSATGQTVDCDVITVTDDELKGAGWARNQGIKEAETRFIVFLDSDDWLEPTFVERCLSAWKPNHYVYTAWVEDEPKPAPLRPWDLESREWHVLTTLLPTDAVRAVGGFDEGLRAMEDTYLYWALTRNNICGIPVQEPLFHYGKEGLRSKILYTKTLTGQIAYTAYYQATMSALIERYQGMSCCGGDNPIQSFVPDQVGDIPAMAMWGGNRRELGIISGRLYPRSSYPHIMSVDPRDVQASPEKWQRVNPEPVQPQPQVQVLTQPRPQPQVVSPVNRVLDGVGELVAARYGVQSPVPQVKTAADLMAEKPVEIKPNASKIRKLAGKGKK